MYRHEIICTGRTAYREQLTMHVLPGFHLNMALEVIYEASGELSIKQRAITLNAASKRGEGMAVYTL